MVKVEKLPQFPAFDQDKAFPILFLLRPRKSLCGGELRDPRDLTFDKVLSLFDIIFTLFCFHFSQECLWIVWNLTSTPE